jgi:P22_AR N-terminal domain./ORF6C domain.
LRNETRKIPFNGGELLGVKDDKGEVWLGIKKACLDIGLSAIQADSEIRKIQESLAFEGNHSKFTVVQKEGKRMINREVVCLNEKRVTLWLAQINLTPNMQKTNPKAVEKLLKYQLEASEVLHSAFYATEEQKQALHSEMGINGEVAELKESFYELRNSVEMLIDLSTINTHQQQKLYTTAKDKIGSLLGGAHSANYKQFARSYFINLWNEIKVRFDCGSYKDLNPVHYGKADKFIKSWKGL